jgi:GNAT superfamily N-acetyltransferase
MHPGEFATEDLRIPSMGTILEMDEHPSEDALNTIINGVREFTEAVAGQRRPRPVACYLRDDAGQIVGGVRGDLWGRSMHVAALWVDERLRGKGHATALMRRIEDYAVRQGHSLVYLETASFQARPFYERLGYRVFAELPEIAAGCVLYFLQKQLTKADCT